MSSEKLTTPDPPDTGPWYAAVRYGVAQELKKRLPPTENVPRRFRKLVVALQQAELQRREADRRQLASEAATQNGA